MDDTLELGLDTFGDVTQSPAGTLLPHAQVIRDVIAEGVLADQVGVDFFGVGEHHRADYADLLAGGRAGGHRRADDAACGSAPP